MVTTAWVHAISFSYGSNSFLKFGGGISSLWWTMWLPVCSFPGWSWSMNPFRWCVTPRSDQSWVPLILHRGWTCHSLLLWASRVLSVPRAWCRRGGLPRSRTRVFAIPTLLVCPSNRLMSAPILSRHSWCIWWSGWVPCMFTVTILPIPQPGNLFWVVANFCPALLSVRDQY